MERREKSGSSGGLGSLIGLAVGALAGAGIAYLVSKLNEESKTEATSFTGTGTPALTNTE